MEPNAYLGGMIIAFSSAVLYSCYKSHLNKKAAAEAAKVAKDEEADTTAE